MDDTEKTMLHKPGFVLKGVPHAEGIGLTLIDIGDGTALLKVPYAEHLIGDPETRVVHGGVVTSLLDNACGVAVSSRTKQFGNIATLDLRIDYMKPATPDLDIFAWTECYRATKSIAFVRGVAFHTDKSDPIASCTAAFMLGTTDARRVKTS